MLADSRHPPYVCLGVVDSGVALSLALASIAPAAAIRRLRHVTKQLVARASDEQVLVGWRRLAVLKWVVDRLHWSYHRGCRDPESAWFVPGVDPA